MSATSVVTTVGIVVATSESAALIKRHSLSMKSVIGGFVLGVFLFPLDSANPELAKSVMILIVISALIINGAPLIELLSKAPKAAKN